MDNSKKNLQFTIFMLVKTTNQWLMLEPKDRFGFLDKIIKPILEKNSSVKMRFYDCEAFSAQASDMIVWETKNLHSYQRLIEELRETKFWGTYFDILTILPSIENGYAEYYNVKAY